MLGQLVMFLAVPPVFRDPNNVTMRVSEKTPEPVPALVQAVNPDGSLNLFVFYDGAAGAPRYEYNVGQDSIEVRGAVWAKIPEDISEVKLPPAEPAESL